MFVTMFDQDLPAKAQPLFEPACGNPKCRKQGEHVLLCSWCDRLTYCSEECQLEDLKLHKESCKMIKKYKLQVKGILSGIKEKDCVINVSVIDSLIT